MTEGTAPLTGRQRGRVLLPFVLVTLIWGSTWLVIRDQIGVVPAAWSVAYRFAIASAAMFGFSAIKRLPLRLAPADLGFAALVGFAQFVINFNFVYQAEHFITSGLVSVVFALLLVPNAALGWIFLRQGVSRAFVAGSAVALIGIGLLFVHEMQAATLGPRAVLQGIALTLVGVLGASSANVMQASERARALPVTVMLAWAMAFGAVMDAAFALATSGAPTIEWRAGYIAGLLYLAIAASAIAFTLYFGVIRAIGPARAAYSSVLVPIIAMGLSTVFEHYRWSWEAASGGGLALAGLVVALSARRPSR